MTIYKIIKTNKNSFFNEAEAYNIEGLEIIALTILPNISKNMITRIKKWATTAKSKEIYNPTNKKFYIIKIVK